MPAVCVQCSTVLPENSAFCPRCGHRTGRPVAIKETPQSLLRQLASMFQKHSKRKLIAKFITPWGFDLQNPSAKIKAIQLHTGWGILDISRAFIVKPLQAKILFPDGVWTEIAVHVLHEAGFDDARAFADAYHGHTGRNVEILKKYT